MLHWSDYRISNKTGFVLENPSTQLPNEYAIWTEMLDRVPNLLQSSQLRHLIDQMPVLDTHLLCTHEDKRLAHLVLSLLVGTYVWHLGEAGVSENVPASIAEPLLQLSAELGLQPIVSHAGLALANCVFKAEAFTRQRVEVLDVSILKRIENNDNWDVFFGVTGLLEIAFAPCIEAIYGVSQCIQTNSPQEAVKHLEVVENAIVKMTKTLELFHGNLDPLWFYQHIRPFLSGWQQNSKVHPFGLNYLSKNGDSQHRFCVGASAAQSSTVQALDILLDVEHPSARGDFLIEMRNYMIREHKQFLEDLKQHLQMKEFVMKCENDQLKTQYENCRQQLKKFRTYHIQIVTKFVVCAAEKTVNHFEGIKNKGTGGQDLIPFLKSLRDDIV